MRHSLSRPSGGLTPITLRIADACRITGIGRSKFYDLIKSGEIEVIKVGAITLVPMTSIRALLGRGRPASAEGEIGARFHTVMHPFLANAILTAAIANTPEEVRRGLSSSNADRREKAEDALVERLVVAMFEADGGSVGRMA